MKTTSAPKDAQSENFNDTSLAAQQSRILAALEAAGPFGLTTLECRNEYNILHPAGRIKELRELSYIILTKWDRQNDHHDRPHRIARYVLIRHGKAIPQSPAEKEQRSNAREVAA